ncbi:MAG: MerR family transcriptional regulator [Clostridiales bacterium]|nr:MerR family transcriptional regulator [Clostridiales bacterium]
MQQISFDSINRKLSISEMAQIHDISRQTLIYYDKIGLFRPAIIDDVNGYRYYSTLQIPLLREICFLRSIGMSLEDIRKHNEYNTSTSTIELLESQRDKLSRQMETLQEQIRQIDKRVNVYRDAEDYDNEDYKPTITHFPDRWVLYHEWEADDMTRHGYHFSLMRVWNDAERYDILPSRRWGTLIFRDEVERGTPLHNCGACCIIDEDKMPDVPGMYLLKEGDYVCMPKYGMSFNVEPLDKLVNWIRENDYEIIGDIYDECLLDTIFYDGDHELDFGELQIPIRKKEVSSMNSFSQIVRDQSDERSPHGLLHQQEKQKTSRRTA